MTIGIIPESDSKGRAVCQFWLQGGKHNVTPTDKITFRRESLSLGRKETTKFPKKTQHKRDSNPARRGRSRCPPLPPWVLLSASCQLEGRDLRGRIFQPSWQSGGLPC